jgi:hypothetical protein
VRVMIVTTILVSVALVGCTRVQPCVQEVQRASKLPSATEVFNLRTKCAEFGNRIDKGTTAHNLQNHSTLSHYDVQRNICFVEVNNIYRMTFREERSLYDGQTDDILALTTRADKVETGTVYSRNLSAECKDQSEDCEFDKATAYIDERMKREDQ